MMVPSKPSSVYTGRSPAYHAVMEWSRKRVITFMCPCAAKNFSIDPLPAGAPLALNVSKVARKRYGPGS
jgi:hypothetical protein